MEEVLRKSLPLYYQYDEQKFFATLDVRTKSATTWTGFKQLCQQYITINPIHGEIIKSHENRFHLIKIDPENDKPYWSQSSKALLITIAKVVSYFTIILPLIAWTVTALTHESSTEVLFYKTHANQSCFLNDASRKEKLETMMALYSFDQDVMNERDMYNHISPLGLAVSSGCMKTVQWIYEQDPSQLKEVYGDHKLRPPNRRSPFIDACRKTENCLADYLLALDPTVIYDRDSFNRTGFYNLMISGNKDMIEKVLEKHLTAIKAEVEANPEAYLANAKIKDDITSLVATRLNIAMPAGDKKEYYDYITWSKSENVEYTGDLLPESQEDVDREMIEIMNTAKIELKSQYDYRKTYRKFCLQNHPDRKKSRTPEDEIRWEKIQIWWPQFQNSKTYLDLPAN